MKILMVCLGNICRSPIAEGVLRARLAGAGREDVQVDSAGTGSWHRGQPPDPRARKAAAKRDYDLEGQRARQVEMEDFSAFDLILAMDRSNLDNLRRIRPDHFAGELKLLLDYHPEPLESVPDPYHGDHSDFARVIELIEVACDCLVTSLPPPPASG